MKPDLTIVKIGGQVIDQDRLLNSILKEFAEMPGAKILVHGGGKKATALSHQLGHEPLLIDGRRITKKIDLEVAIMVYAGLINKTIVARLQSHHCNALGFSGADGGSILSEKRPIGEIDYGWVGDIKSVNAPLIDLLIQQDVIPVFCALTHDGKGQMLNTNADTIAAEISVAMSAQYNTQLVYCFDKNGVLENVSDDNSVISRINPTLYASMKRNGSIHSGMFPKIDNGFYALKNQVNEVVIGGINILSQDNQNYTTLTL